MMMIEAKREPDDPGSPGLVTGATDCADGGYPLSLLICDDHALFREALALLLQQQPGWRVVGQAGDGVEAVRLAVELDPDVVVLDVSMPGGSGIEAAASIHRLRPDTHIVALSMFGDAYHRARMQCSGTKAYVLKNEAGDDLIQAIQAVIRGERYDGAALREATGDERHHGIEVDQANLTVRERDVLRLLAEGQRTKEIAKALAISPKTVETYRHRIVLKLGVDRLVDLIKYAIRAGIVGIEPR